MTAEVAILNRNAVALAADSKVTVGAGASEKTYDTINKIFTLSKVHPAGIMIYGNADFMQYPWETIVKQYRKQKGAKSERTIESWAGDFIRYMRGFGHIQQHDIARNISSVLFSWLSLIEFEAFVSAQVNNVALGSPQFEGLLITKLEEKTKAVASASNFLTKAALRQTVTRYASAIAEAHSAFIKRSKNRKLADRALEFVVRALAHHAYSPITSGIVIAGFGDTELFPSVAVCQTDGYIGSRVRVSKLDITTVSSKMTASVAAFAQGDIVYRFMEGIDESYSDFLVDLVKTAIIESNLKTFRKWAPTAKQTSRNVNAISKAATNLFDEIH
jgi:hypothetical protein